jgi:DNA polymerase-3 subunit epsilon
MEFIAFDIETTGTVAGLDRIVEISAVKFLNLTVESVFSTLVDPKMSIPRGASAVNGITDDMVVGKPTIDEVLSGLTDFVGDFPLVAHNAPFDSQFLVSDFQKYEVATPAGVVLDTLPIARKVLPGLANYKLGTLVQHLKLPTGQFHRAEQDAISCGQVFMELLKRISVAGQAPQISHLVALTGKLEFRFPKVERKPKQLDLLGMF